MCFTPCLFSLQIKATQACELGIDGGVHIQSCGHCLHLKCHQTYLQTLKVNTVNRAVNPRCSPGIIFVICKHGKSTVGSILQ
jgi:hypothetical protein